MLQRVLRRCGMAPRATRWLDVGCGRGELLSLGGGQFAESAGCDLSPAMLQDTSNVAVHQQRGPAELPFPGETFDLVTAVCVYHHVHGNDRRGLSCDIQRVLRPGGLCCMIEHNPWNPVTRRIVKRCPVDRDAELLTAATASKLLEEAGFESLGAEYFLFVPERLHAFAGGMEPLLGRVPLGGQYALIVRKAVRMP